MDDSLDTWFKREVLPHEGALVRFLNRVWSKYDDVHDLRQEVYIRVYQAAQSARPNFPKAFVFATARHLMMDRLRRARVVSIEAVGDVDALNVLVDELSPERRVSAWQELRRVTHALNGLPPRCREVVWLRKVDELSTKEVAELLGVKVRTVEAQILKGMRLMGDALYGRNEISSPDESGESSDAEVEHGEQ